MIDGHLKFDCIPNDEFRFYLYKNLLLGDSILFTSFLTWLMNYFVYISKTKFNFLFTFEFIFEKKKRKKLKRRIIVYVCVIVFMILNIFTPYPLWNSRLMFYEHQTSTNTQNQWRACLSYMFSCHMFVMFPFFFPSLI